MPFDKFYRPVYLFHFGHLNCIDKSSFILYHIPTKFVKYLLWELERKSIKE